MTALVELMTEQNVYGGKIFGVANNGTTIPNLFTLDKASFHFSLSDPILFPVARGFGCVTWYLPTALPMSSTPDSRTATDPYTLAVSARHFRSSAKGGKASNGKHFCRDHHRRARACRRDHHQRRRQPPRRRKSSGSRRRSRTQRLKSSRGRCENIIILPKKSP